LDRIKEGIGDKLGLIVQFFARFVGGFAIAFAYNWQMTLVMLSLTPIFAGCGVWMEKVCVVYTFCLSFVQKFFRYWKASDFEWVYLAVEIHKLRRGGTF
jgi:ABC-type multidrug transport system fused ATPase/permease subunit